VCIDVKCVLKIASRVVEHMANVLCSMITPFSYFEMNDKARWQEYQEETKSKDPSPEILARGGQAWESMGNTSLASKRHMAPGILTTEFLQALEGVMNRDQTEEMWFATDGDEWDQYCDNIERVFVPFVFKKPFDQPEEQECRDVRDQWRRKWDFVKFDHGANYMQKPLMLLTPLTVETLSSALGKVRQAIAEVSNVAYSNLMRYPAPPAGVRTAQRAWINVNNMRHSDVNEQRWSFVSERRTRELGSTRLTCAIQT
jgi:hypothetical protein